jgi:hypothetical protein
MSKTPVLIETSFADAIAIIVAADELPERTRRHWPTSLRQIAKALDKPLELIPARYSAVRADLGQLHEVPAGLTAKTLQNHKSNVKSALLWLAREKGIPQHGAPLAPAWEQLRAAVRDGVARSRLSCLMRFCSASNITPVELNEALSTGSWAIAHCPECPPGMPSDACWLVPGMRISGISLAGRRTS